jgi:molybdenum cofactor cytidylyltransferase
VRAAIVLAAGASRRFGAEKLLAPLCGQPLLRWSVEHALAAPVDDVIVVLGRGADAVRPVLDGLPVRVAVNRRWEEGMSSSIRAGVCALRTGTRSLLFALGDEPTLGTESYARVIAAEGTRPIVVPSYRGVWGHPVLFAAGLLTELLLLRGDHGARAVIARDPERVAVVELDRAMPPDVDTAEDLARLREEMGGGQVA